MLWTGRTGHPGAATCGEVKELGMEERSWEKGRVSWYFSFHLCFSPSKSLSVGNKFNYFSSCCVCFACSGNWWVISCLYLDLWALPSHFLPLPCWGGEVGGQLCGHLATECSGLSGTGTDCGNLMTSLCCKNYLLLLCFPSLSKYMHTYIHTRFLSQGYWIAWCRNSHLPYLFITVYFYFYFFFLKYFQEGLWGRILPSYYIKSYGCVTSILSILSYTHYSRPTKSVLQYSFCYLVWMSGFLLLYNLPYLLLSCFKTSVTFVGV